MSTPEGNLGTPSGGESAAPSAPPPSLPSAPAEASTPGAPAPPIAAPAAPAPSALGTPSAPSAPSPSPGAPGTVNDVLAQMRQDDAALRAREGVVDVPPVVEPPPATAPAPAPVAEPPATLPPSAAATAPEEEVAPVPAPESALAPIFQQGRTDEALTTSIETFEGLRYSDPIAFDNLVHGAFFADEDRITGFVLQRLGVPTDKIEEVVQWAQSGQVLPSTTAAALPPFPVPDASNHVVIDGNELDLSVDPTTGRANYPGDRLAYDNAKKLYDIEVKEQARTAKEAADNQTAATQRQAQVRQFHDDCFRETSDAYLSERTSLIDSLVAPALTSLAAEDTVFGDMFKAYVEKNIEGSDEMMKIGLQAKEHMVAIVADTIARCQRANYTPAQIKQACIARIKEGRMVNFASEQDRILRKQIATLRDKFVTAIARRNRAEIAATATVPVLPPDARTVESTAPPLTNNLAQANTLDDILAGAREHDRQEVARQRM